MSLAIGLVSGQQGAAEGASAQAGVIGLQAMSVALRLMTVTRLPAITRFTANRR